MHMSVLMPFSFDNREEPSTARIKVVLTISTASGVALTAVDQNKCLVIVTN